MSLAQPAILWVLLLPLGAGIYFLLKGRSSNLKRLVKISLPFPLLNKEIRKTKNVFRVMFLLMLVSMGLLAFVAARPTRLKTWVRKWTEGIDIVLVLDVSESMDAEDLEPSRLLAAKSVMKQFISHRPNDRIALVTFGGEAVMKSPLTRDFDFLNNQVDEVKLRELKQGTAIGMGITNGIARLRKSESKNRVLILLTDGDSNVGAINPITAAHLAQEENIRIYPIGIGKSDRVVIPIYAYDAEGRKTHLMAEVPSYLNPQLLRQVAQITGGKAYMARDTGMLANILQEIDKLEKTRVKMDPMSETEELFLYPALLATIMLAGLFVLQESRYARGRQVKAA